MVPVAKGIQKLDTLLGQAISRSALAGGLRDQEALAAWPRIVGEEISRHSQAQSISDGLLVVKVESSVWAQELQLLTPQIQAGFDEILGVGRVKTIRFHSRTSS